jgi:hypothetical protein
MMCRHFTITAALALLTACPAWAEADKEQPLPEKLAKAQELVSKELTKQNANAARVVPVQSDAVSEVLADYQFVAVVFSPYPVARPTPKGFKQGNVYAVSKDGTLKLLTDAEELQKFFAANAAKAKDEKTAKEALTAWLRLTQEFSQDGFFDFAVNADSLKVEKDKEGLKATGIDAVKPKNGDKGEIKAVLSFDADGKLTKVDETRNVEAGNRPVVQNR